MMSKSFTTEVAQDVFYDISLGVTLSLIEMNCLNFSSSRSIVQGIETNNDVTLKGCILDSEDYANDLFIIRVYLDFIKQYIELWSAIYTKKFSTTWDTLQNCLDLLRLIKRLSSIDISFYEKQLTNLEKAYPYKVFTSIGMTYTFARCVICDQDIDSFDCEHIRGKLYWGQIARAQITGSVEMDHLALTKNPRDKRCILKPQDGFEDEFKVLEYIASVAKTPSQFDSIKVDDETSHVKVILSNSTFKMKQFITHA